MRFTPILLPRISPVFFSLLSLSLNAKAELVAYQFNGGAFAYDLTAPDTQAHAQLGIYTKGVYFYLDPSFVSDPQVRVNNNNGGVVDLFSVSGTVICGGNISFELSAATSLFASDALPNDLDLNDYSENPAGFTDRLRYSSGGGSFASWQAEIDSLTAVSATGTVKKFQYTASVTSIQDDPGNPGASIGFPALNDTIIGTFTYDTAAPDDAPAAPNVGYYTQGSSYKPGWNLGIGGRVPAPNVTINNNNGGVVDLFTVSGQIGNGISMQLRLSAATSHFTDDSLPTGLDLNDFSADPAGFTDILRISKSAPPSPSVLEEMDITTLSPISNFETWIKLFYDGADADPQADPDGDGINNLVEYTLCQNPRQMNSLPLTRGFVGGKLRVSLSKSPHATDTATVIEVSDTLLPGSWTNSGTTVLVDDGATLTVEVDAPFSSFTDLYYRLKVDLP